MYGHEIRWWVLVPMGILLGFVQLFLEVSGVWFVFPARVDWLWGLAFYATLRVGPLSAICAFGVCGLMRDLLLGPRLGAGCIAFIVVGWVVLSWRVLASDRGIGWGVLLSGVTGFLVSVLRHGLEYGGLAYRLLDRVFFVSLGDGVLTAAGYLPLVLLLHFWSFRPWRERAGY